MAMSVQNGMEMKMTIKTAGISGTKNKTIRYLDPLDESTKPSSVTHFAKDLMRFSADTYTSTTGSIDLGILDE